MAIAFWYLKNDNLTCISNQFLSFGPKICWANISFGRTLLKDMRFDRISWAIEVTGRLINPTMGANDGQPTRRPVPIGRDWRFLGKHCLRMG